MAQLCLAPDPNPTAPSFAMPASATDCHMHMFGTAPQYPYVDDRDYTPPEANVAAVRKLYTTLGIQRVVAIQPSVYGTDNRCQLEFAAALGMPFRAIIVPAADLTDSDLDKLHQQGVRGIRYILAHPGGLDLSGLERDADRCRARGWHLEFLAKGPQLIELEDRGCETLLSGLVRSLCLHQPERRSSAPRFPGAAPLAEQRKHMGEILRRLSRRRSGRSL